MSRDLTPEERTKFVELYGTGDVCKACGTTDVLVKIWENYGTDAYQVGGDIGPSGIIGAIVACDACGHSETIDRSQIKQAG